MKSLKGHLLAASPHLPDPNFLKSVVLIVQHNEQGAVGVVLNRPSQKTVKDVWEKVGNEPCQSEEIINLGGPVAGPLMAIHRQESCCESQILPGIYFATHKDHLHQIVAQTDQPFKIFSGYAGWTGGQLESEMKAGGWLTTPATPETIFFPSQGDLWKKVAQHIGEEIVLSSLKIKHIPDDPSVN